MLAPETVLEMSYGYSLQLFNYYAYKICYVPAMGVCKTYINLFGLLYELDINNTTTKILMIFIFQKILHNECIKQINKCFCRRNFIFI